MESRADDGFRRKGIIETLSLLSLLVLPVSAAAQVEEGPPPQLLLGNAKGQYDLATHKRETGTGDPSSDYQAALENYHKYLAAAPGIAFEDSASIFSDMGECYFFRADYENALIYFQWLIDRNPERGYLAGNYLFAGYAVWQTKSLTDAIPYYANYVELMPDDLPQRLVLAGMYRSQGMLDQATNHYLVSLERDRENQDVVSALVNLRTRLPIRFEEITLKLIEHYPENPAYMLDLGQAYLDQFKLDEAISYIGKYLDGRPEDISGWQLLGDAYKRKGEYEQALEAFRKVLSLDPQDVQAYATIATVLMEQEKIDLAIREAARALAIDAENGYANAVMGDAAREWLMSKFQAEYPGENFEKMPYNFKLFLQERVAGGYYEKARSDPQWRDHAIGQINYLSSFYPTQADRFMAKEKDKIPLIFPPPAE